MSANKSVQGQPATCKTADLLQINIHQLLKASNENIIIITIITLIITIITTTTIIPRANYYYYSKIKAKPNV